MNKFLILLLLLVTPIIIFSQERPPKKPDGYWCSTTLKIAYFFGTLDFIEKNPPVPEEIIEYKDLIYKEVQDRSLKLDIYHLRDLKEARPVLVFIHGGAWKKGKKEDYRRYLVDFAKRGYVTATIQYSLLKEAKYPTAVNDVKCAISWIKENAKKYLIDPDKIAVIGGSAGGHLAMMTGYSHDSSNFENDCCHSNYSSKVQAVVNLYGPSDLTTKFAREHQFVEDFIGEKYSDNINLYSEASPVTYLSKDDPPTLIFQGTIDELVPFSQADNSVVVKTIAAISNLLPSLVGTKSKKLPPVVPPADST